MPNQKITLPLCMSSDALWVSLWAFCQDGVLGKMSVPFPSLQPWVEFIAVARTRLSPLQKCTFFICYNFPALKVIWFEKEIESNCLLIPHFLCFFFLFISPCRPGFQRDIRLVCTGSLEHPAQCGPGSWFHSHGCKSMHFPITPQKRLKI